MLQSIAAMKMENDEGARVLAIDLGSKTMGLALSDPGRTIAQSLGTVKRKGMEKDLAALARAIEENKVGELVVGLPVSLSGNETESTRRSRDFARVVEERLGLPVALIDESLTTMEAEEILLEANLSRKKRKKVIDGLAAVMILRAYLNELEEKKNK